MPEEVDRYTCELTVSILTRERGDARNLAKCGGMFSGDRGRRRTRRAAHWSNVRVAFETPSICCRRASAAGCSFAVLAIFHMLLTAYFSGIATALVSVPRSGDGLCRCRETLAAT